MIKIYNVTIFTYGRICREIYLGRVQSRAKQVEAWDYLEKAQTVFEDYEALRIFDPDHSEDEDRFLLLGLSSVLRLLVVCHCYRENEELIRIISARKAT